MGLTIVRRVIAIILTAFMTLTGIPVDFSNLPPVDGVEITEREPLDVAALEEDDNVAVSESVGSTIISDGKTDTENVSTWGGSYTTMYAAASGTYYIESAEHLRWLAVQVNAGNTFAGKTIVMLCDVNLASRTWYAIGTNAATSYRFAGTFDGNGHKITNIYMTTTATSYVGLFGYISSTATVRNITIESGTVLGSRYVGGVVGYVDGGYVKNCTNKATVRAYNAGDVDVGGVVGLATTTGAKVVDCMNYGTVSSNPSVVASGKFVGGVVGRINGGNIYLWRCGNYGDVSGQYCIGGVLGEATNFSHVIDSFNAGKITNWASAGTAAGDTGGVIGYGRGYFVGLYNVGEVYSQRRCVGGVIGSTGESTWVRNSYNAAKITTYDAANSGLIVGSNNSKAYSTNCLASNAYYVNLYSTSTTSQAVVANTASAVHSSSVRLVPDSLLKASSGSDSVVDRMMEMITDSSANPINNGYPVLGWQVQDKLEKNETTGVYEITNYTQLAEAADLVALGNSSNFTGETFRLMNDLDLKSFYWNPIGGEFGSTSAAFAFNGTFDGNGHTISKLWINRTSTTYNRTTNYSRVGFFGCVGENFQIKNVNFVSPSCTSAGQDTAVVVGYAFKSATTLVFDNVDVTGSFSVSDTAADVGVLLGWGADGGNLEFRNCDIGSGSIYGSGNGDRGGYAGRAGGNVKIVGGSISNLSIQGAAYCAGFIGKANGSGSTVTITGNPTITKVSITSTGNENGGLVGYAVNFNIDGAKMDTVILNVSAKDSGGVVGKLGGTGTFENIEMKSFTASASGNCFGALLGYSALAQTFKNCSVETISNISTGGSLIGGIAGQVAAVSVFENCTVGTGTIQGTAQVGGIVGALGNQLSITNCHNSATVKGTNGSYVAGIVGDISAVNASSFIKDSTNSGAVSASSGYAAGIASTARATITNCHNTGSVTATADYAGGIAANHMGNAAFIISECSNTGDVTSAARYVGGLAGAMTANATSMNSSFNKGNVKSTYSHSSYESYVGGIVGAVNSGAKVDSCYNRGNVTATSAVKVGGVVGSFLGTTSSLVNCYSTGTVSASNYRGSVVGQYSAGTLTNSYSLSTLGISATGSGTSSASNMSVSDLKAAASILGSYYADDDQETNDGYPIFGWQAGTFEKDEDGFYYIYNYGDLSLFSAEVNKGNTFEGETIYLMDDIIVTGKKLKSIGGNGSTTLIFKGTFEGQGHVIDGITISDTASSTGVSVGLFGYIASPAIVRDVTLGANSSVTGYSYVGGIAGRSMGGVIENCTNKATVTSMIAGLAYTGGIVGFIKDAGASITNCHNEGAVSNNTAVIGSGEAIGGIAGSVENASIILLNCSNKGEIQGFYRIGGVVGYNVGCIVDSFNKGNIICYRAASTSNAGDAGGIAGYSNEKIISCYNLGNVTSSVRHSGGISGSSGTNSKIINCYSAATITACNSSYVGLILGNTNGVVSNCHAANDRSSTSNNIVMGTASPTSSWTYSSSSIKTVNWDIASFKADSTNINGGYPILGWEVGLDLKKNSSNVYEITDASQLGVMADLVGTGYNNFAGEKFILMNDINLTANGNNRLEPIGGWWNNTTAAYAFCGSFDGNSKVLSNLNIKNSATGVGHYTNFSNSALFGLVGSGFSLNNLTINGANIVGGAANTAVFIGYSLVSSAMSLNNLATTGTVSVTATGGNYAAVIMGRATSRVNLYTTSIGNASVDATGRSYVAILVGSGAYMTVNTSLVMGNVSLRGAQYVGAYAGYLTQDIDMYGTHTISDITINATSSQIGGLIGKTESWAYASTARININSVTINAANKEVGGIVGFANQLSLNYTNIAKVSLTDTVATDDYGGLMGKLGSSTASINNCSIGTFTANTNVNSIGALLGYSTTTVTISNSYADTVNITSTTTNVGGLVGKTSGATVSISNSYVGGGKIQATDTVGGIIGTQTNGKLTMTNCYNKADIVATKNNGDEYVGGLSGRVEGSENSITNCYNTGKVTASASSIHIGGLVGQFRGGTITKCYNTGAVSGYRIIGGLVGDLYAGSTVTQCYNTGAVTATYQHIGGLVGRHKGTLDQCFNTGKVTSSTTQAESKVGGLAGATEDSSGIIRYCYNTADVVMTSTGSKAGGIIGTANSGATISSCYSIGHISGTSSELGCVAGYLYGTVISNTYTLSTCPVSLIGKFYSGTNGATKVSDETLNAVPSGLGTTYFNEINYFNDGFPVLKWYLDGNNHATLDGYYEEAIALDTSIYVDFSDVQEIIDEIDAHGDKYATQAELNEVSARLLAALEALEKLGANYNLVEAAIAAADALDPLDYTNFSDVTDAIDAVVYGLSVEEQDDVNEFAYAIHRAIQALVAKEKYNIIVTQKDGFTINSEQDFSVRAGENFAFTVAYDEGYSADRSVVEVNGVAIEAVNGVYTISNINEVKTIEVFRTHLITFLNKGGLTEVGAYVEGVKVYETMEKVDETFTLPAGPFVNGFIFMGWDMTAQEIAETTGDVTVKPIYEAESATYIVRVMGGGLGSGVFKGYSVATVTAPEGNFSYWIDQNGNIVSYYRKYSFYVHCAVTLTPVYDVAISDPLATRISTTKYNALNKTMTIYAERSAGYGYTVLQHGIISTNELSVANGVFEIGSQGVDKSTGKTTGLVGLYSLEMYNFQAGSTVYARSYMVVVNDDTGEIMTIYSDVSTITA